MAMTEQRSFWDAEAEGEQIRSPLCSYERHCGGVAVLGPEERDGDDCINRTIRCLTCEATGVSSRNLMREVMRTPPALTDAQLACGYCLYGPPAICTCGTCLPPCTCIVKAGQLLVRCAACGAREGRGHILRSEVARDQ